MNNVPSKAAMVLWNWSVLQNNDIKIYPLTRKHGKTYSNSLCKYFSVYLRSASLLRCVIFSSTHTEPLETVWKPNRLSLSP